MSRRAQCNDFRMCAWIVRSDRLVMSDGEQFTRGIDQDRADRDFIEIGRDLGLCERLPHPGRVAYSHSIVPGGLPEMS